MIVEKTLGIDIQPAFLDATDALAIALCHHYQISSPLASGSSSSGSWEKFIEANPTRVKK
jgi:crossover junction endodeoxyribonuclease RuvC